MSEVTLHKGATKLTES